MKKFVFSILFLIPFIINGQQSGGFDCQMTAISSTSQNNQSGGGISGLIPNTAPHTWVRFFAGNDGCSPVTLNVNYIFLYKDDGTGNFDFSNPDELDFVNDLISICESTLMNIEDDPTCNNLALYSGLSINSNIYQINNTTAWDLDLCNPVEVGNPCFNTADLCHNTAPNMATDAIINSIGGKNDINVFFNIERTVWDDFYLNGAYLNNCTQPAEQISFSTGRFPNANDVNQFMKAMMTNKYLGYLWRSNQWECHLDEEGLPIPAETLLLWYKYIVGRGMAHEIGHTLGLTHNFTCPSNIMTKNFGTRSNKLFENQIATINRSIAIKNARNPRVDCIEHRGCEFTLPENESLRVDYDTWIDRDIVIEAGATLIVEHTMHMAKDAEIKVLEGGKLIVDGGRITSCDDTWKGIKVVGGNADFDVRLVNATIENTSSSAVSMFPPLPWPQSTQHGNGIIQAENSTFNNCKRMVEFIAFQSQENPSYIRACTQNGGKWGVTNWNCQNIEISNNNFFEITNHCIGTEQGSFLIQGNRFYSGQNDIFFNNVSTGFSSTIRNNYFLGDNVGFRGVGTTIAQNRIENNYFNTGFCDIWMDGDNFYRIYRNSFNTDHGSVHIANGKQSNLVRANDFNGNIAGLQAVNQNSRYNFIENCFSTTIIDAYIEDDIAPVVAGYSNGGGVLSAANNCFTHSGSTSSSVGDIGGAPDPFVYIEPNDHQINCIDAIFAHPNVDRDFQSGLLAPVQLCNTNTQLSPPDDPCEPDRNIADVELALAELQNELASIENNEDISANEQQYATQLVDDCIQRVTRTLVELRIQAKDYQTARNLLQNNHSNDAKIMIYNTYLYENNLEDAQQFLNNIPNTDQSITDYKYIQNIQLERLEAGGDYNPSTNQLRAIRDIALKTHPYAAYGKALYYAFTNEIISSTLPELNNENATRNYRMQSNSEETISIFPNPFENAINISLGKHSDMEVEIVDFLGKTVYHNTKADFDIHINTSSWRDGLYIVSIRSGKELILQDKIMLVRD